MQPIKPPIYNGTGAQNQARSKERAEAMQERFPGVKFSLATPNPLGVAEAKKRGVAGAGLPQAILDQKAEPIGDPEQIEIVLAAFEILQKQTGTDYQTLTQIVYTDRKHLDFQTLFGVFMYLQKRFPYQVRATVNRLGDAVHVRIPVRLIRHLLEKDICVMEE